MSDEPQTDKDRMSNLEEITQRNISKYAGAIVYYKRMKQDQESGRKVGLGIVSETPREYCYCDCSFQSHTINYLCELNESPGFLFIDAEPIVVRPADRWEIQHVWREVYERGSLASPSPSPIGLEEITDENVAKYAGSIVYYQHSSWNKVHLEPYAFVNDVGTDVYCMGSVSRLHRLVQLCAPNTTANPDQYFLDSAVSGKTFLRLATKEEIAHIVKLVMQRGYHFAYWYCREFKEILNAKKPDDPTFYKFYDNDMHRLEYLFKYGKPRTPKKKKKKECHPS
jgi:hypothetical protein